MENMFMMKIILFFFALSHITVGETVENVVPYDSVIGMTFEFPCEQPRPRAIAVSDLLEENVNDELRYALLYSPPFVVLHRCGESGCCEKAHEQCQTADYEKINLEISYLPDPDYMFTTFLTVRNDTSCTCASKQVHIN